MVVRCCFAKVAFTIVSFKETLHFQQNVFYLFLLAEREWLATLVFKCVSVIVLLLMRLCVRVGLFLLLGRIIAKSKSKGNWKGKKPVSMALVPVKQKPIITIIIEIPKTKMRRPTSLFRSSWLVQTNKLFSSSADFLYTLRRSLMNVHVLSWILCTFFYLLLYSRLIRF